MGVPDKLADFVWLVQAMRAAQQKRTAHCVPEVQRLEFQVDRWIDRFLLERTPVVADAATELDIDQVELEDMF